MTSSAKQNCKNQPSSLADGADLKGIKEGYNNYSNRYVINPEEEISNLKNMIRSVFHFSFIFIFFSLVIINHHQLTESALPPTEIKQITLNKTQIEKLRQCS